MLFHDCACNSAYDTSHPLSKQCKTSTWNEEGCPSIQESIPVKLTKVTCYICPILYCVKIKSDSDLLFQVTILWMQMCG